MRRLFAGRDANQTTIRPRGTDGVKHLIATTNQPLEEAAKDCPDGLRPRHPAEHRERVFDKFFRVEPERPAGDGRALGTGIGLCLYSQIVAAHGGRIWCEPGDGGTGTRIAVELIRKT
jgi:signal transduction histidine kinase